MSWDYRVVRKDLPTEDGTQDWYSIQEIYYDDVGDPGAQTIDLEVTGGSIDVLRSMLEKMLKCLDKPIIEEVFKEDKDPNLHKQQYNEWQKSLLNKRRRAK